MPKVKKTLSPDQKTISSSLAALAECHKALQWAAARVRPADEDSEAAFDAGMADIEDALVMSNAVLEEEFGK